MNDKYLDKEEKFYNYHTDDATDIDIFDVNVASNSYASEFLHNPQYMRDHENKEMQIEYMTPKSYFEACAKDVFNKPVANILQQWRRDEDTLDHLKQVLTIYKKKFPIGYIDYARHDHPAQEGLHRMMVAGDLYGWDIKFPVMIIRWVDEDKASREKHLLYKNKIERYLDKAINKSLMYKYYNINDLKDQLYSDIEDELRYEDEFENSTFELELKRNDSDDGYKVIVNNLYEVNINDNDINWTTKSIDDELDDEDLSDWMKELLNDIHAN